MNEEQLKEHFKNRGLEEIRDKLTNELNNIKKTHDPFDILLILFGITSKELESFEEYFNSEMVKCSKAVNINTHVLDDLSLLRKYNNMSIEIGDLILKIAELNNLLKNNGSEQIQSIEKEVRAIIDKLPK